MHMYIHVLQHDYTRTHRYKTHTYINTYSTYTCYTGDDCSWPTHTHTTYIHTMHMLHTYTHYIHTHNAHAAKATTAHGQHVHILYIYTYIQCTDCTGHDCAWPTRTHITYIHTYTCCTADDCSWPRRTSTII